MIYLWIALLLAAVVAFILAGGRIGAKNDRNTQQQMSDRWRKGDR